MKNTPKRILIVEDDKILRDAYYQILSAEGYDVCQANNGKEALEQLQEHHHDLILLDILMPEMDGLDFLKAADLANKHPHTKVIAFSNLSDHQKMELMVDMGVTKNILKSSLSPKQLARTINKLLI